MFKYFTNIILAIMVTVSAQNVHLNLSSSHSKSKILEKPTEPLKVLALMVEFQKDNISQTTGDGTFNSGYPDSAKIDAPNHNAAYFKTKLLFAKNYYEELSKGAVSFADIKVLQEPIKLDHPIWFYNRNDQDADSLNSRLIALHSEAWLKAENKFKITQNYKDYNTFVIFHAGSGQEFSLEVDETPLDIPSSYYSNKEILKYNGDNRIANNSLILPECQWQSEGYKPSTNSWDKWYYPSMNGIVTLMFGHRLGLPTLYDSGYKDSDKRAKSGVGYFGLMDQGSGNVMGLLPSAPMAWSRIFLEWQDAINIKNIAKWDSIPLVKRDNIYKIDINEDEYFLIENRLAYHQHNECFGYNEAGDKVIRIYHYEDNITSEFRSEFLVDKPQIVRFDNYDFGLPASGAFIWHIDKRKTTANMVENNLVNEDWSNRGIFLEEADGALDIGQDYWLLDNGYHARLGWEGDAFYDKLYKLLGPDFKATTDLKYPEFSSASIPVADTKDGVKTMFRFFNFSSRQDTMFFSFTNDFKNHLQPNLDLKVYTSLKDIKSSKLISNSDRTKSFLVVTTITDSTKIYSFSKTDLTLENAYPYSFQITNDKEHIYLANTDQLISVSLQDFTEEITLKDASFENSCGFIVKRNNQLETIKGDSLPKTKNIVQYSASEDNQYILALSKTGTLKLLENSNNTSYIESYSYNLPISVKADKSLISFSKTNNIYTINLFDYQNTRLYKFNNKLQSQSIIDFTQNNYKFKTLSFIALGNIDNDYLLDVIFWDRNTKELVILNENGTLLNNFPISYSDFSGYFLKKIYAFSGTDLDVWTEFKNNSIVKLSKKENYKPLKVKFQLLDSQKELLSGYLPSLKTGIFIQSSLTGQLNVLTQNKSYNKELCINNRYSNKQPLVIELGKNNSAIVSSKLVKNKEVYCWPNPANKKQYFRIGVNAPALVKITIFDFNGKKIKTIKQNIENSSDITWDTRRVAPGAYIAIVEVKNSDSSSNYKTEKFKIKSAIIK